MKTAILTALIAVVLMPGVSYAQTPLEVQYRNYLLQLIELLQEKLEQLIALESMEQQENVKENEEVALGSVSQPVPPMIDVTVGEPAEERDELNRVTFSFLVKTNGEKMQVRLERPDGSLAIDGGLNAQSEDTFDLRHEYAGTFKWTIRAVKGGVEKTEEGQFEIE